MPSENLQLPYKFGIVPLLDFQLREGKERVTLIANDNGPFRGCPPCTHYRGNTHLPVEDTNNRAI